MKILTGLVVLFIGAGALVSGCEQRAEDPVAVDKEAVPPLPVIPPGQAGVSSEQGLAKSPGEKGIVGEPAPPGVDTTIADIMNRPELYIGKNVSVVSSVEEIFTPWSFKLDERQVATGGIDNDMLVIGAVPLTSFEVDPSWLNKQVNVIGTVRVLQAADFRREYGRGVDDLLFRRFEGKPAIIAQSVKKAG
jgi:hypothetical protein